MDFSQVKRLTIPEGNVVKITSGGVVLWQKVIGPIPSAYQQVEWIEAAANVGAYIDLGFSYDTGAVIHLGQYILNDNTAYPFGAAENSGKLRCMFSSPYSNGVTVYFSDATTYQSIAIGYTKNTLNEIVATFKKGSLRLQNLTLNRELTDTRITDYAMTAPLYLFAQNYNGSPRFGDTRRIAYFQYYDKNGTLICDLYPCYRKSDGVIGMYDTVSKTLFTNAGTGAFGKGADVCGDTPKYTNLAKNFTTGRLNSSGNVDSGATDATTCTDYIGILSKGDVIRVKGFKELKDYNTSWYNAGKAIFSCSKFPNGYDVTYGYVGYSYDSTNGIATITMLMDHAGHSYVRFSGILADTTSDVVITINEPIT